METLIRSGQYRNRFVFVIKIGFISAHLQFLWGLLSLLILLALTVSEKSKTETTKQFMPKACGVLQAHDRKNCYPSGKVQKKNLPLFSFEVTGTSGRRQTQATTRKHHFFLVFWIRLTWHKHSSPFIFNMLNGPKKSLVISSHQRP